MSAEFTRGMFKGENFNGLYGTELQGDHEREMGVIDRADRAAVCTNLVLAAFVILALGGSVGLSILSRSHLTHQWYYLGPGIGLGATTLGLIAWMAIQSYLHLSEKQQANERYAQASGERVALHQILEDTLKAAVDEQALAAKVVEITATEHRKALIEAATAEFTDEVASESTEEKRQILEVLGREGYKQQKRSAIRVLASEFPEQMIAQVGAKQRDLAIYLAQNLELDDDEDTRLRETVYAKINATHDKVAFDILVSEFSDKMIEQVTKDRAFAITSLQTANRAKIDGELREAIYAKIGAPENSVEANLLATDADAVRAHVAILDEAAARAYRLAMLEHVDPKLNPTLIRDLMVIPQTAAEANQLLPQIVAIASDVTTRSVKIQPEVEEAAIALMDFLEIDERIIRAIQEPGSTLAAKAFARHPVAIAKIANAENEYFKSVALEVIFHAMSEENKVVLFKALVEKGRTRMGRFVTEALGRDLQGLRSPNTTPSLLVRAFFNTYPDFFEAHVLVNAYLGTEVDRAQISLNSLEHLDDQAAQMIIRQMDEKHFIRQVKTLAEEVNPKDHQTSATRQKLMQLFRAAKNSKSENIYETKAKKAEPNQYFWANFEKLTQQATQ